MILGSGLDDPETILGSGLEDPETILGSGLVVLGGGVTCVTGLETSHY